MTQHRKRTEKLGRCFSSAYRQLTRDIMFDLIVRANQNICFRCGHQMDRDNYSIEHKDPWLNSDSPVEKFFDLSNISFSHIACNAGEMHKRLRLTPEQKEESRARKRINDSAFMRRKRAQDKKYGRYKRLTKDVVLRS